MKPQSIAVISSSGIGDALIFSIASHHLKKMGHQVTTFHRHLPYFGSWLETGHYRPLPAEINQLLSFDALVLQHDNTPLARSITSLRKSGLPIYVLYPNYRSSKHDPLIPSFDFVFDENKSMVSNVITALQTLFGGTVTDRNSLIPPPHLVHRAYRQRIALHPTSGNDWRNWPKKKFFKIANRLEKMGFEPAFVVAPHEASEWPKELTPLLPTLEDLASFLYESGFFIGNNSGPGHLASYLSIPHIILAHQERHMRLWKPGWTPGFCLYPPSWIPNFKLLRIREVYWSKFITTHRVLNNLKQILIS